MLITGPSYSPKDGAEYAPTAGSILTAAAEPHDGRGGRFDPSPNGGRILMNRRAQPRRPDNLTPSRPDSLPRLGSKLPVTVTVNLKIELELETLAPSREAELRLDSPTPQITCLRLCSK